jgi:hypothetical protein
MNLFPTECMEALKTHQGSGHPYLQMLSSEAGGRLRKRLSDLASEVSPELQERWAEAICSQDIRRFFQGYAELTTAAFLAAGGWKIIDHGGPGPTLAIERSTEEGLRRARVLVLAFIQPGRTSGETESMALMIRSLNRSRSRHRIAVLVRRWHPHEFDPEPVRRAVDLWLRKVARGTWDGSTATYEDDHISLELTLTERTTRTGEGSVAFALGPLDGFHTLEVVESRLVLELETYQLKAPSSDPLIVSMATNAGWALSPGFVRSMLYGLPSWHSANGAAHRQEMGFADRTGHSIFQDPSYAGLSATMLMDHAAGSGPCARAYLNPWASKLARPGLARCATFGVDRWESGAPVMRWFGA